MLLLLEAVGPCEAPMQHFGRLPNKLATARQRFAPNAIIVTEPDVPVKRNRLRLQELESLPVSNRKNTSIGHGLS